VERFHRLGEALCGDVALYPFSGGVRYTGR
jgi:hypothetical protein